MSRFLRGVWKRKQTFIHYPFHIPLTSKVYGAVYSPVCLKPQRTVLLAKDVPSSALVRGSVVVWDTLGCTSYHKRSTAQCVSNHNGLSYRPWMYLVRPVRTRTHITRFKRKGTTGIRFLHKTKFCDQNVSLIFCFYPSCLTTLSLTEATKCRILGD